MTAVPSPPPSSDKPERSGVLYPWLSTCTNGCDLPRYGTHQPSCPLTPKDPPRERCICGTLGRGSWAQHRPICIATEVSRG